MAAANSLRGSHRSSNRSSCRPSFATSLSRPRQAVLTTSSNIAEYPSFSFGRLGSLHWASFERRKDLYDVQMGRERGVADRRGRKGYQHVADSNNGSANACAPRSCQEEPELVGWRGNGWNGECEKRNGTGASRASWTDLPFFLFFSKRQNVSPDLVHRTSSELSPTAAAANSYGASEALGITGNAPPDFQEKPDSVGPVFLPNEFQIRDPETGVDVTHLREKHIGDIWMRGPTVSHGYWKAPETNKTAFVDGFYNTGLVSYFAAGGQRNTWLTVTLFCYGSFVKTGMSVTFPRKDSCT